MAEVLAYVRLRFVDTNKTYVYQFFFTETPEYVWGNNWDVPNPSICGDLTPEESTYSSIYTVRTSLPLKTAQETSCYSMEYATYGILALAWIDIENLDVYPEHGRMTLHFGDSFDFVQEKLSEYGWEMRK